MAPILRRTTSDTYARHSTMSSVVGTGTGAFSTAFGASSLLHAASGSTKQATSRTCSMRIGMFVEKFFMVLPWTGGWKWYSCVDPLPLGLQRLVHGRRHERGDIPAQARDLAHQRGRNEAVLLGGRQEQRLDFGNQVPDRKSVV